jgi:radical SAM superfamily enzyme YgiQ (UPF0313 family)
MRAENEKSRRIGRTGQTRAVRAPVQQSPGTGYNGRMSSLRRRVLLAQLPIPPLGPGAIRGNVPLAAGYLKLFAQERGLASCYDIDIFPSQQANELGDRGLVEAILAYDPWMVGFTCYLWNIDRTLWICERLKERRPDLRIVLGGPEITVDNRWVLEHTCVDYAAIGEGEQTFADLLLVLVHDDSPPLPIDGLHVSHSALRTQHSGLRFRKPLASLDIVSSPYLAGILDAADEQMLMLETLRGCVFKCKFCYYPKSYDDLYFASEEKIVANLRHARERGAKEVVLLDPTLNQRRDFAKFLRLLIHCNPERQFTYFGELRAEGINQEIAGLLREANFTEVEVGLQSIDPHAQELMDRKNNLRAVERGIQAMLDVGIKVKVDLIIGLPGDTPESVRRGMRYLRDGGWYTDVQVFNLAILPGTAFRHEAEQLGLVYQPRPPYYVLRTPTLRREDMFELMQEAQDIFEMEWDSLPPPVLDVENEPGLQRLLKVDLSQARRLQSAGLAAERAQAFTLWLQSSDFQRDRHMACELIDRVLSENPFTTLQVALEPTDDPEKLSPSTLAKQFEACQNRPTYLDRYYALQPGRPIGAKRLIVVLPATLQAKLPEDWVEPVEELATIAWRERVGADIQTERCEQVLS